MVVGHTVDLSTTSCLLHVDTYVHARIMTTIQVLKDMGEQMGLKGNDLRDFVKNNRRLKEKNVKNSDNMR